MPPDAVRAHVAMQEDAAHRVGSPARPLAIGSAALLALSGFAFWPNYLSRPFGELDRYTHAHAAVGVAWMLLLVAQSLLVASGRRAAHRMLGRASWALAPAFVVSGVLLAHFRFSRMTDATFAREAFTLYLPVAAALLFALAYSGALRWRRPVALHARFMACTALPLVDPVVGRCMAFYLPELPAPSIIQAVTFGLEAIVVLALARTLPSAAQGRAAFQAFAGFYVLVLALWFALPHGAAWREFATWFRALGLT